MISHVDDAATTKMILEITFIAICIFGQKNIP